MGSAASERLTAWGITILRVVVGFVFVMHGGHKLFVQGFSSVAAMMGRFGIPWPMLAGIVVSFVEFFGGGALLLGLFTRWAAILLAIDMAVAMLHVHLRSGFFLPRGYEYALTLLAANLALALAGPGAVALDTIAKKRKV